MFLADVPDYSRFEISQLDPDDVSGSPVSRGDVLTMWGTSPSQHDSGPHRGAIDATGRWSWLALHYPCDFRLKVIQEPRYAGEPESILATLPTQASLPGDPVKKRDWPEALWANERLHAAVVGHTDHQAAVKEILCAITVAPSELLPLLATALRHHYEQVVNAPDRYPAERYPWRLHAGPARDVEFHDDEEGFRANLGPDYLLLFDGSTVTFPRTTIDPHGNHWTQRGMPTEQWSPMEERTREYAKALYGSTLRKTGYVDLPVVLIPRPDNEVNSRALSVAVPAAYGGSPDDRLIGYIRQRILWRLYRAGLHTLAPFSGWEIACTALYRTDSDRRLMLAIPHGVSYEPLVAEFFARKPQQPPLPTILLSVPHTDAVLQEMAKFEETSPVGTLVVGTSPATGTEPQRLTVTDASTDWVVGVWREGHLVLRDERHRDSVCDALRAQGLRVAGEGGDPACNVTGIWRYGGLEIGAPRPPSVNNYAHLPAADRAHEMVGRFDVESRVLWVQDARFQEPLLAYMHRVGLTVDKISQAPWPWQLDEIVPLPQTVTRPTSLSVLRDLQDLVPDGAFDMEGDIWADSAPSVEAGPSDAIYQGFVGERAGLFPDANLTGDIVGCRICGQMCGAFKSAVCTSALAYCQACLRHAADGLSSTTRKAAAVALGAIGHHEFSGQPLLESQLATVHIDPDNPVLARQIDRLVLLRFAVRRGVFPWTLLLVESGLANEGMRMARGTILPARDGHLCLSLREKAVDDFFHQHQIAHDREPLYPADDLLNPRKRLRADWVLDDGTFVEMWGMATVPEYAAKMHLKERIALKSGIRLIGLLDDDLPRLRDVFADWLPNGSDWQWSPLSIAGSRSPTARRRRRPDVNAPGGAAFNAEARRERLMRCRQAVELRSQGMIRREIAARMGVKLETLPGLLRDGVFYADPSTDPVRLALAKRAREAMDSGTTKAAFAASQGLSRAKGNECWRDADVVFGPRASGTPSALS